METKHSIDNSIESLIFLFKFPLRTLRKDKRKIENEKEQVLRNNVQFYLNSEFCISESSVIFLKADIISIQENQDAAICAKFQKNCVCSAAKM